MDQIVFYSLVKRNKKNFSSCFQIVKMAENMLKSIGGQFRCRFSTCSICYFFLIFTLLLLNINGYKGMEKNKNYFLTNNLQKTYVSIELLSSDRKK